jgi:hypothetical protein
MSIAAVRPAPGFTASCCPSAGANNRLDEHRSHRGACCCLDGEKPRCSRILVPRTAFYFIPSAMTGFIVSVFPFRNRVSSQGAFEGLELGEGKLSGPVLRGPGGRKAAWPLGKRGSGK